MDHGVPVSGPYDRKWFRSIYFTDPDGQILEIATKGPGYDVDEPMAALGQTIIVPGEGHLRGQRDEQTIHDLTWAEPVPTIVPTMALDGIHHVTGITHDVELLGDFYEKALGLRIIKKSVNQDDPTTPHWFWGNYDGTTVAPHSAITLFQWPANARRARGGTGQTHHIAFRAKDAEEQSQWRDHLLSIGLQPSPVMERSYFESIYFQAPDGMLLEIATDGPGFALDEDAEALGTSLKLPAWLEGQRPEIEHALVPLG
jgi:glyoxalase family protein